MNNQELAKAIEQAVATRASLADTDPLRIDFSVCLRSLLIEQVVRAQRAS